MNTAGKVTAFIGGGVGVVAVTILAMLGIQNWQKDHATPPAAPAPQLAQVIGVVPHFESESKTTQHCYPVQHVTSVQPTRSPGQSLAPLIGGALGGLAGSQIGNGHGREVAIASGATLGAIAGKNVETNSSQPQQQVSESLHCTNQTTTVQVQQGYDVTYLYNGQQGVVRMDTAPVLNSLIPPPVATVTTATMQMQTVPASTVQTGTVKQ